MFLDFWRVMPKYINVITYQHVNRRAKSAGYIMVCKAAKTTRFTS